MVPSAGTLRGLVRLLTEVSIRPMKKATGRDIHLRPSNFVLNELSLYSPNVSYLRNSNESTRL